MVGEGKRGGGNERVLEVGGGDSGDDGVRGGRGGGGVGECEG